MNKKVQRGIAHSLADERAVATIAKREGRSGCNSIHVVVNRAGLVAAEAAYSSHEPGVRRGGNQVQIGTGCCASRRGAHHRCPERRIGEGKSTLGMWSCGDDGVH